MRLPLLLTFLVAACADDGYQVRRSQELACGTATVSVRPEGEPLAGVTVLIHDASGALFGEAVTDAAGKVSTDIPPDAQVTVLLDLPQAKLWAATTRGVQPGASLVLDGMPHAPFEEGRRAPTGRPFQLKLVPFEASAGGRTSNYYIDERAAHVQRNIYELEAVDTDFGPYTRTPLALDRYGTGAGTFGVLAYARTGPDFPPFIDVPIVAYSFGEIAADAPAGSVLELPPFRTDFRTVDVGVDGHANLRAIVTGYHDGAAFELARGRRNAATGELALSVPPGFGNLQSARVCAAFGAVCTVRYDHELAARTTVALPTPLPFSEYEVDVLSGGAVRWSPPALSDVRDDESIVFEAAWLEDRQFHPDQKLVAWTVAYAADEVGPFELPSLPEAHRRYYPLHAFSGDTTLIRASSTFFDRDASLAHFATWADLLRSDATVERIPGAGDGDFAQLAIASQFLP